MVTGPLLARMLGPDGRGYLAALTLWPLVITQLREPGDPLLAHLFDRPRLLGVEGTCAPGHGVARLQAVILVAFQALWLLLILNGDPHSVRVAGWLTLALVPAMLAQQYGLALLQGHLRLRLFNAMRLMPWFLYAIGVATLFVASDHAIVPIVAALLAAFWITGSTCLISGLRLCKGTASPSVGRRFLVSFGLRGLLSSFSAVDVLRPDQVVLALFLSPSALGLYVVGLAFTNLPYFIAKSVGLITFPWVAARAPSRPTRGGRCGRSCG